MTTYVYGAHTRDQARTATLQRLVERHRKVFDALLASWTAEIQDATPDLGQEQLRDMALKRATRELVETYRDEYDEMLRRAVAQRRRIPGPVT